MKSIRGASSLLLALALVGATALTVKTPVDASTGSAYSNADYSGPYYGVGNLPLGCEDDPTVESMVAGGITNRPDSPQRVAFRAATKCHHMRSGLSALDSPQIDVLVTVPATPGVERDMRIMRQSVEMWEGGIDHLAEQMGMLWLADGVDFHVTLQRVDPVTGTVERFSPHPFSDPEIVVIAALNPPATFGIGIDPLNSYGSIFGLGEGPCLPVENPFNMPEWEAVPAFDNHHGESGTYEEDCKPDETGGNVCFAINTTLDPAPDLIEIGNMFDLVSHEVGHCLSVGHVGDGAEGVWGGLPTNDIMAYSSDPPGRTKCVSTLDVEGFAIRMSKYLDTNGELPGRPTVEANVAMDDGNPFQIQHPDNHFYASTTGAPTDCPQPDIGPIPGPRTDWTPPAPADGTEVGQALTIIDPEDGAESEDGEFNVTGTVKRISSLDPPSNTGTHPDPEGDSVGPLTDITELDVEVTNTHVVANVRLVNLWPTTSATSPTSYSVTIDGRRFDSFVRYPIDANPMTWDTQGGPDAPDAPGGAGGYLPAGTSTWDFDSNTVTFKIPFSYLEDDGVAATPVIETPFHVSSSANLGTLAATQPVDFAPDGGGTLGVSGARLALPPLAGRVQSRTVDFEYNDGSFVNTFYPEQSTLGIPRGPLHPSHTHEPLVITEPSDVKFTLTWTDTGPEAADLDLYVTGAKSSGDAGATAAGPKEEFTLPDVPAGTLTLEVDPFLVTDPFAGAVYELSAVVSPKAGGVDDGDRDGDGVLDGSDTCPDVAGTAPDGCPPPGDADGDGFFDDVDECDDQPGVGPDGCPAPAATEEVELWIGTTMASSDQVDTSDGRDRFQLPVSLPKGTHEATVKWVDGDGDEIDRASLTLTHTLDSVPPSPGGGGTTLPATDGGTTDTGGAAPTPVTRPPAGTRPPGATPAPAPAPAPAETIDEAILTRVQGEDRIATSVEASRVAFTEGSAQVAVLARADKFADGMAGTSLAVAYGGPLLLTPSAGLDPRVVEELQRAVPEGGRVFVLGGASALPLEMDGQLEALGYSVRRLAGRDRFETAARVAQAQPSPQTILIATGHDFADALAAGAAAAQAGGTVVLTDNGTLPKATVDYLAEHPDAELVAIGGPAAAALPGTEAVVGADRFDTSVKVARRFFSAPQLVGLASGLSFPDSLSGGALLGRFRGPLILTPPDQLAKVVLDYLNRHQASIDDLMVMGGEAAVGRVGVEDALEALRT